MGGRVVKYAKYKRQPEAVVDLFSCVPHDMRMSLYDYFVHIKPNIFVPIPLHKSVVGIRGFNQSSVFAHILTQAFAIPTVSLVEKLSEREPQSKMSSNMRRKNVRGLYHINEHVVPSVEGKTVCIVDDVVTTGTTLEEVSRVLRPYAKAVYGITLLRSFE
ncbi:MAG: phosphoribosyltransferase family protein [Candidatus Roizmanbacteria bacterium]|nr:phosphoribosyltransferase family protein [Candidatus Roizmanbacteria bacterium]